MGICHSLVLCRSAFLGWPDVVSGGKDGLAVVDLHGSYLPGDLLMSCQTLKEDFSPAW